MDDADHREDDDCIVGTGPVTVALIDDYDVIVLGVAQMFDAYADRVRVAELDMSMPLDEKVDVALYDAFAQPEADHAEIGSLAANPLADKVVVYTWNFHPELVEGALKMGANGYLSKALPAADLVDAIEAVHAGQTVVSPAPSKFQLSIGLDWPGRSEGLNERESEILALITQGKSNAEIADLVFLSINSIKSYIRSLYRKIGVRNRVEAVLWGVEHGFKPDVRRIESWIQSA